MLSFVHDGKTPAAGTPAIDLGIVDSKRLQMFYVAAKEGTFAAAAQILKVSPSAISHAIKALEEDLGSSLFKRSGPQVRPTGAAIRLLPVVEDLLFRMASIKSELAAMDGRVEQLVFAAAPSVRGIIKPTVMSGFRECFPRANVEILISRAGSPTMAEDEVDFEIGHARHAPPDSVRRHLADEELGVYAAPFHGLGQHAKIAPAELRRNTLVFPDRLAYELVVQQALQGVESGLRRWILPDAESARELAMEGQCLAVLPAWAAEERVREGTLKLLKISGCEFRRGCCAWWKPSRPLAWIAEVFLSLLAGEFDTPSDDRASDSGGKQ